MRLEVYLSYGEREGMFRTELHIDGIIPSEALIGEFPKEKVADFVGNFYEELESRGINVQVGVKNRGIEDALYEDIKDQVSRKTKSIKATLN